jgi:hypothetical protein
MRFRGLGRGLEDEMYEGEDHLRGWDSEVSVLRKRRMVVSRAEGGDVAEDDRNSEIEDKNA